MNPLFFSFPPWAEMWILAGFLWLGFKILSLRQAGLLLKNGGTLPFWLWVGMDIEAFRGKASQAPRFPVVAVLRGAAIAIAGIVLINLGGRLTERPVWAGWLGMTGLLCLLHFGCFEILARIWRYRGMPVRPIMEAPWKAKSLSEFWGRRWNRAFSDVARQWVFRPLVRRLGLAGGTMAGFLLSGGAHELVISLPARGGFGLPTLYFLFQGAGVLAERAFHLRGTNPGRWLTWIIVLAPAFWLFHPAFMTNVMIPFLKFLNGN